MSDEPEHRPFDAGSPSLARLYDFLLGGKDHFAADRAVAGHLLALAPDALDAARANRGFHGRAVRWLAEQGIGQFIDLGCGLPTWRATHEIARQVRPDARVAYVDNDQQVLTYARALLAGDGVAVVGADLRDPESVLGDPGLRDVIDFRAPAGLLMTAALHFVADDDDPRGLVARYLAALAPGSYLALSHATSDKIPPATVAATTAACAAAARPLILRERAEIKRFTDGLELAPPYEGAGPDLAPVGMWAAVDPGAADTDGARLLLAAIARKP